MGATDPETDESEWEALAERVRNRREGRTNEYTRAMSDEHPDYLRAVELVEEAIEDGTEFVRSAWLAEGSDLSPSQIGTALSVMEGKGRVEKVNRTKPHKWRLIE